MRLLYFIIRRGDSRIARIHEIHRISCHCEEIATSGKALLAMTVVVGVLMRSRGGAN